MLLDVPLGGGARQDVSSDLIQPPFVTDLQNCAFDKEGVLRKAPGATALTPSILAGPTPNGLATDGRQLVVNREDGTYVYSAERDQLVLTHERALRPARVSTEGFAGGETAPGVLFCDSAVLENTECLVWQSGGVGYYMVREVDTRAVLKQPTPLPDGASTGPSQTVPRPRVVAHAASETFVIAAQAATADVLVYSILAIDGSVNDVAKIGFGSGGLRDMDHNSAEDPDVWIAIEHTAGAATRIYQVDPSSGISVVANIPIGQGCDSAQIAVEDASIYVVLGVDAARQATVYRSTDLATVGAGTTFTADWTPSSATQPNQHMRVALAKQNDFGDMTVFWSLWGNAPAGAIGVSANSGVRASVEHRIVDDSLADISAAEVDVLRNYVISSRGFRQTDRGAMVSVAQVWESTANTVPTSGASTVVGLQHHGLQDHALVVEVVSYTSRDAETGQISTVQGYAPIARYNHDTQYSLSALLVEDSTIAVRQHYVGRWTLDTARGVWTHATSRVVERSGGLWGVLPGAPTATGGGRSARYLATIEPGDSVLADAGRPLRYAGAHVTLDLEPPPLGYAGHGGLIHWHGGFHACFDGAQSAESTPFYSPERPSVDTDVTGDGKAYRFRVVYKWTDGRGNVHRSAPSRPSIPVNLAGGVAVTVQFPVPPPTALSAALGRQILVDVYQTDDLSSGAAEDYYLRETVIPSASSDPHQVSVVYSNLDSWPRGPILYTSGDILAGEPPPALLDVVQHGSRLVGVNADDPTQLWVTKPLETGVAPEWSSNLTVYVPGGLVGGIVAVGVLDDKLVALAEDRVVYTYGDGPDATGSGGYAPFTEVTRSVGCSRRETVATSPRGLLFWGPEGYWMVTPQLAVEPVGDPVEDDLAAAAPAWTCAVSGQKQIRISLSTGLMLVWDWQRQQWSRWTSRAGVHGVEADGTFYRLNSVSALRRETAADWGDPDGANIQAFTTAWIRLENLNGFQRVRRVQLGGDVIAGDLKVSLGHNHDSAYTQTATWTSAQIAALPRDVFEIHVKRQKCSAIRVRIEEPSLSTGGGFAVSRLTLLGEPLKRTLRHLPDGAKK